MLLCLPDDCGGTEISKVKRLDLEHPSVSAVEGIFTVLTVLQSTDFLF